MTDPHLEETQEIPLDELQAAVLRINRASIDIQNNVLDAEAVFEGPAAGLFAAAALQWFRKIGANNYVQCEVTDKIDGQKYTLTMQRQLGITPSVKLAMACGYLKSLTQVEEFRDKRAMARYAQTGLDACHQGEAK
jgi:hypothetical protein